MDSIEDKLDALEKSVKNQAILNEVDGEGKNTNNNQNAQSSQNNEVTEQDNAMIVANMSYNEVTEMAKKSNLVSTAEDENFVAELSDKNKDVLKASIDLEREKVEAEKQRIKLEQEKLETEKEKNLNERLKGKFGARLDAQEFYYKSLQPMLETFGIKRPMNVVLMWIIVGFGCLTGIYILKFLLSASFGTLIAGATSESRKGFAKGCLWTAVAVLGVAIVILIIFALYKIGVLIFA